MDKKKENSSLIGFVLLLTSWYTSLILYNYFEWSLFWTLTLPFFLLIPQALHLIGTTIVFIALWVDMKVLNKWKK